MTVSNSQNDERIVRVSRFLVYGLFQDPAVRFLCLQCPAIIPLMESIKHIHWQDQNHWLGYLEDHPDYWTQGESFEDLQSHLWDLYRDLNNEEILSGLQ